MAKHDTINAEKMKKMKAGDVMIFNKKDRNRIDAQAAYNRKNLGIVSKTSQIKGTTICKLVVTEVKNLA